MWTTACCCSIKMEPPDEEMTAEMVREGVTDYNERTRQRMSQANMPRRFVCETCQKCFATKSDLRTHIRTHTGETPYKCDYCDRSFKQRGHRKLHIQVLVIATIAGDTKCCNTQVSIAYISARLVNVKL